MVRRFAIAGALALVVLVPPADAPAASLKDYRFGVVLMHGKEDTPNGKIYSLTGELKDAGVRVETPEMPWSKFRRYDATYDDAMKEIDKAVAKLKAAGAERIVVAGHSFGANAALGYGARREGVAGVIALAPGHVPESSIFRYRLGASVEAAKKMVADGKGDEKTSFDDFNQGRSSTVTATPKVYLSHFDPDGPAVMPKNAAALKPGTALLWVIGYKDPLFPWGSFYAFDKAPPNAKSKYVAFEAGHLDAPDKSVKTVLDWLKSLAAN